MSGMEQLRRVLKAQSDFTRRAESVLRTVDTFKKNPGKIRRVVKTAFDAGKKAWDREIDIGGEDATN